MLLPPTVHRIGLQLKFIINLQRLTKVVKCIIFSIKNQMDEIYVTYWYDVNETNVVSDEYEANKFLCKLSE